MSTLHVFTCGWFSWIINNAFDECYCYLLLHAHIYASVRFLLTFYGLNVCGCLLFCSFSVNVTITKHHPVSTASAFRCSGDEVGGSRMQTMAEYYQQFRKIWTIDLQQLNAFVRQIVELLLIFMKFAPIPPLNCLNEAVCNLRPRSSKCIPMEILRAMWLIQPSTKCMIFTSTQMSKYGACGLNLKVNQWPPFIGQITWIIIASRIGWHEINRINYTT